MAIIDTLKLARALRDKGGFSPEAAEATAEALNDAFGEQVATKHDTDDLKRDITQLGSDLRKEMAEMKADLRKEMAEMKAEILKWMFAQTFVILAVVAALHFVK